MLNFEKLCNQNKKFSRLTGVKLEEFLEIRALAKVELSKILKKDRVYRHQQELGLKSQIINSRDDIESKM